MALYVKDTIAALATAPGVGAIAILRLSGDDATKIAARLLLETGGGQKAPPLDQSHRARRATLVEPGDGRPLDDVLVLPMLGEKSATGEDVVEIHCHGGALLSDRALRAALAAGARPARPGEFTERAFLNGRLDLCQAEAVADLTQAASESGLHAAWQQLEGGLSSRVLELRDHLLEARALIEAHLDFPEEEIPPDTRQELCATLAETVADARDLCATYSRGRLARNGARVVLVGRPNAGKSSLMNALLGRERALVSENPGTTRDYLEEPLALGGLQALLSDTAGIHLSADAIEQAGVATSRTRMEGADLLILVLDGAAPLRTEDLSLLDETEGRPRLLVRNKSDLDRSWFDAEPALPAGERLLAVSAKTGAGVAALSEAIEEVLPCGNEAGQEEIVVTRARHYAALETAAATTERGLGLLDDGAGLDLLACELQAATAELDGLVGQSTPEDVLDRIFSRFCVGK